MVKRADVQMCRATHGTRLLSEQEVKEEYGDDMRWDLTDTVKKNMSNGPSNSEKGGYFTIVKEDPTQFVEECSADIRKWLKSLREGGKLVFLLTSSQIDYAACLLEVCLGNHAISEKNMIQEFELEYPNDKEKSVQRVDVLEHKIDYKKGIDYRRRVAICENVLPQLLRKFSILNEENIQLEEEAWLDMKTGSLRLESHNVTWAQYAKMGEESHFTTSSENPNWTQFEQHGEININGLGPFGKVLEVFTKQFLNTGVKRAANPVSVVPGKKDQVVVVVVVVAYILHLKCLHNPKRIQRKILLVP
nr:hypothetical protein BaRGS_005545 [Batillaria attramentaria]